MSDVVSLEDYQKQARTGEASRPGHQPDVFFDRRELDAILNLYAFMVAQGEWRDYAISHDRESCCFAVFRRTSDEPLYRIVKDPSLARRQGAYSVVTATGLILKRGAELGRVLKVLDKRLSVVS